MRMYDIILNKRNNKELTSEEIHYFVSNYTNGKIPDYQVSALLMAIYFNKLNKVETAKLTQEMVNSGEIIDLSSIEGIKIDKHSTGGVGDTTSLVLAPMVAALGIPVAKMSGRGLGHTGGTIDKLESFKGFSVEMPKETFIKNVNKNKIAIGAQTANLAPADKKLYALRDVTATVDNMALIASSIMSKKIAAGADCIVLDVKTGSGAFMKNYEDARELAKTMVEIGKLVNKKTVAIISDMDQPLGYAIGNSLEVQEAIDTLKGKGPKDLFELCLELGSQMVILAEKAATVDEAKELLRNTISNGAAFNKFKDFIKEQGGDISSIENEKVFSDAKFIEPVISKEEGYVYKMNAEKIGIVAMELGAGRATKDDIIDLSVGILLNKKVGDFIAKDCVLAYIHGNDEEKVKNAKSELLKNIIITKAEPKRNPLIYEIIK